MIRSFLEEDAWCYWVVSVGALLSFLGLIVACICSCRRNENKNEFLGLAGMVTLNNLENEGFNRIPTVDVSHVLTQEAVDGGKRTTSANRSLPDIPKDKNGGHETRGETVPQDIYETTETIGDHSELYATVQDTAEEQNPERETQEPLQQNSIATEAPGHQYARFSAPSSDKNVEHPYAQLQNVQKTEASQLNRNNVSQPTTINNEKPSTSSQSQSNGNPVAPPRARRSSSHNSLLNSEPPQDIQAANAITGGVQANQDLPYMTPPLLMLLPHPPQVQHSSPQQHFSGDSQDSKGYTSISVREPLANIIAQTKTSYRQNQTTRPLTDPHYATVSDDSDEMYAAIDEQDKVYTSGSETYAQIQPMATEMQRIMQNEQMLFCQPTSRVEETSHAAPQPPSVDSLRHVAHAHSRQASSSSANSSIVNPGSPKPEKRQANSPLPPPPEGSTDVYASVEKRVKGEDRLRSSISMGKSLEDMYAKVMKKKKDVDEQPCDPYTASNAVHPETVTTTGRKLSLVEISRASWSSHDSVEIQKKEADTQVHYATTAATVPTVPVFLQTDEFEVANPVVRPETDVPIVASLEIDHGYEAVSSNPKKPPPRVTSLPDPNYEMLRPQSSRENDYQSKPLARNSTDLVTYSVPFKHRQISNASSEDPGYEKVRLRRRVDLDQDTDSEPNYESMPHEPIEPNYASVCRPGDSDTDPNYESVSQGDPNYESVKYMSLAHRSEEPPYEQVNNYQAGGECLVDGYEKVRGKQLNADYEKIELNRSGERLSNGGDTDDEQYVQV